MPDSALNQFLASVADSTERLAFVPSPPTPAVGPDSGYFLLQRDDNSSWSWDADAAAWVPVASAGGALPSSVQGDLFYASGTNTVAALNKNASATRYLSNTGASNNPAWAQVNLADGVSGDLPFANLAQGSALSVLGVTGNATADNASIAAGTDGFVLRRSGTALTFGTLASGAFPSSMYVPRTAEITLTDAQVKDLPITPIAIVPAPGAGFYNRLIAASVKVVKVAGYTGLNATFCTLELAYGVSGVDVTNVLYDDSGAGFTSLTTFLTGTGTRLWLPGPTGYLDYDTSGGLESYSMAIADAENRTIQIFLGNGASVLGGGNAGNSMRVIVEYVIEAA